MSLDNIPVKSSVEIETVKLDQETIDKIQGTNIILNNYVSEFGAVYLRRKDLLNELEKLETYLQTLEKEFKTKNDELKAVLDEVDERYPQGRINIQEGTVQYQPGVPSRKQLAEQQLSGQNLGSTIVKD